MGRRSPLVDNAGVNVLGAGIVLFAAAATGAAVPEKAVTHPSAGLGVVLELEKDPGPAGEEKLLAQVRATGATVFGIEVSWPAVEPSPGQYRTEAVTRAARVLRQSGATVHLDLSLVAGREKVVPADLAEVAFDDVKLSLRLGHLLDALEPALLDASTISLGYDADVYFADKPEELKAYRRLFEGSVTFLKKKAPDLMVGVTTLAPTESPAPVVAALLHQHSPVRFYVYAPFQIDKPYVHRSPEAIESDWKQLLERADGHPIAFPEVSFSSAAENGSSPDKQADFIRRMRRLVAATDGRRLLFARYATLRDQAPPNRPVSSAVAARRAAFLANRGLQTSSGQPKPAWKEWVKAGR